MEHNSWWKGCVIYQIYPRSFQDSMGNGIGDLSGIRHRLDHIASLNVDAIWISPFFTSPMKDWGYDVSDYCNVDPMFGSLEDMSHLIDRAHDLGLKVMIDLVLSHTSDQHPWFVQSSKTRNGEKSDWYIWSDPKPDGTCPNNWLSIFGGSAWTWHPTREQYFFHNFLASQPDLNYHNPDVQQSVLEVARFWLDLGVDGFRLDTLNFYTHDAHLRDNPALPTEARSDTIATSVNPYNYQQHLYDRNRPETLAFVRRFRGLLDRYGARIALGELGDATQSTSLVAQYTQGDDHAHLCYSFDLLSTRSLTAQKIRSTLRAYQNAGVSDSMCWVLSNHDVMRHATRLTQQSHSPDQLQEQIKLFASLLLSLNGAICLYQGEELGLPEAEIPFEHLQDPYGKTFWPEYKGRDGCRTPMIWSSTESFGGFSPHTPWLPLPPEHLSLSVESQNANAQSILAHYRTLITLRSANPALRLGSLTILTETPETVFAFIRRTSTQTILCAFHLSDTSVSWPNAPRSSPLPHAPSSAKINSSGGLDFGPSTAYWGKLED